MKSRVLKTLALASLCGFAGSNNVYATSSADDVEVLKQQMQQLIEQNQRLISRVSQLESAEQDIIPSGISDEALEKKVHKLYEQNRVEQIGDKDLLHKINKYVSFSGLIEVEGAASEDFESVSDSGFELATVELGFDGKASDWASGHVLFLYEEGGDDEIVMDEGFITLGNTEQFPLYMTAGRLYVPFGNFESNMISDPLTLEIAETQETALQISFEASGIHGTLFAFNGDTNEGGDDSQIDQFGASIGYTLEQEAITLDVGMSYINSIGDTDGLSGILTEEDLLETDYVDGIAAYAVVLLGPVSLIGEYVTALDDFDFNNNSKPMAYNIEAGFLFNIVERESTVAIAYQGTDDLGGYLPESRILGTFAIGILESTTLAFEYAHDNDYDTKSGGTDDSADSFTAQLSFEF